MKTILFFISIISFVSCSHSNEKELSLPYKSEFKTEKNWDLSAGAKIDRKLNAVKLAHAGSTWLTSDRLVSEFTLPIKANSTYTISLKSKTDTWPPPSVEISGSYYNNGEFIANSLGSMITNSAKGIWEESTVYIETPNNQAINRFKIRIIDMPKKGKDGNIWIKDVNFKKGFHTTLKKPIKKTFNSSLVKIDKLGNIQIKNDGKFKPFFPIGIYTNNQRKNWNIYKKQGFNIAMWTDNASSIKKAKDAGLYSSMQLIQYIIPVEEEWIPQADNKKIAHLKKTIQEIKNKNLDKDLLFYYIDNEFYHLKKEYTQIVDIVKELDGGLHPLYMLSGTYAIARKYNKRVDFTGTYAAEDMYEDDRTKAFSTLNQTQNQNQPTIIAQINRGVDKNFKAILFGAIAKGARGMAFWKDGADGVNIEKQPWWDELPKISKEIEKMMPLITSTQFTSWSVACRDEKVVFGTREVNKEGFMIISNPTRKEKTVTFDIHELPYKATSIEDYFTHKTMGKVNNNSFSITLKPQSAEVLKLVGLN